MFNFLNNLLNIFNSLLLFKHNLIIRQSETKN